MLPNGTWQIDSPYSPANANYVWNTTGAAPGVHQFQIWARAQGSSQTYQAYIGKVYTVQLTAPCTSAGLTFSPVGHAGVGTSVTITPSSSGCPSPTYRVVYQAPSGVWQELQGYTANKPVIWNTTLASAGLYNFQVWARAAGSTANYEAYIGKPFTLDASTQLSPLSIGGGWATNCQLTSQREPSGMNQE